MNKIQLNSLIKPLVDIYDDIELEIIKDILKRLTDYNDVRGSMDWLIDKLGDLGSLDKNTLNIIKKNKKEIAKVLKEIMNNAPKTHKDYMDILENYYEKGLLKNNPLDVYNGSSINRLVNEALKETTDIMDLINTKVIEATNETYKKILNKAYIETASGIYTYQESIRKALKEFTRNGIDIVHYENGRTLTIESVVRRDVITRVNKLVGDIDLENAQELGTNLVYVDQHLGARIRTKYMKNDYEAHAEWQGKVYMIEGSNDKYDNFYEKTGYGEMLGLKGINCYHDFRPFFEWEKVPDRIDEEENAEAYKRFQQQRAYERKIRKIKREKVIAKEMYSVDEKKALDERFKTINDEYEAYLKENNLKRDYSREYVVQIKRNGLSSNNKYTLEEHPKPKFLGNINTEKEIIINNTLKIFEEQIKNDKIENAIIITREGEIYQCFGNENNVWPDIDLGDKLIGSYVTHNHVYDRTEFGFSMADINLFEKYKLSKIRGIDYKYTYELNKNGKDTLRMPTFDEYVEDCTIQHIKSIEYAIDKGISYKRWKS